MGQLIQKRNQRRGVITLELILIMPIMIIFVVAAVEFGVLLAQVKQVEFASREGARLAAQQTPTNLSSAVGTVSNRVERVLQTGNIPGYCKVILQHNVAAASNPTQSTGSCNCPTPTTPTLPTGTNLAAVRVTVCVGMEKLAPDFLSSLGLSLNGKIVSQTTTWPYVEAQILNYSGNIYVANTFYPPSQASITLVDPNNANRSITSAAGTGSGGAPLGPSDIIWDDDNQRIIYSDSYQQAIVAVDPATGNRTVISASFGSTVGSGPALWGVSGLALEPSGMILALTSNMGLIRINPATGNRTVLSSSSVGTGDVWNSGESVAVNATGQIFVVGTASQAGVYQVNAGTGNRTLITADSFSTPPQTSIGNPSDAIFDASGKLLIASDLNILAVDVTNGTRTQISGIGKGTGTSISAPQGIAVQTDGTILVTDTVQQAVYAVDPTTGNRSEFSGSSNGTGSNFGSGIRDLTIVP